MKQKKITREEIPSMEEKDRMKYEIAEELGLLDQVLEEGWKSLSSKETGRIGGLMTRRRRKILPEPECERKKERLCFCLRKTESLFIFLTKSDCEQ